MLTRVVRMEFQEEKIEEFQSFFHTRKSGIADFQGCIDVKLMKDASEKNVFYTLSEWRSEKDLEAYRNSDFFRETWKETKRLFSGKPLAYSLIAI